MNLYDFEAVTIDGGTKKLSDYRGKTVLIVNVASACGYTPQYAGLEALYRKHKDSGFVVLGFPCNQFGAQEPGTEAEIAQFCKTNYDVTFPLFAKVDVNGDNAHPLFTWLKSQKKGIFGTAAIKWNFSKFLVDANGDVVKRYGSGDTPEAIEKDLNLVS
ncbi:MAG: glutathione peroxidase [Acidobacteria bacterium]|nr:MAG: glutathione peroxidase [Acidobacteriota bacterium]